MKKTIAITMIVLGIVLVSYQPMLDYIIKPYLLDKEYDEALNVSHETITANTTVSRDPQFDFDAIDSLDSSEINDIDIKKENVLGSISVPSVSMELPILYGTTNKSLNVGAGTMKPDQQMGKGNYALAGHNNTNRSLLFAPIRDIEEGDAMILSDGKRQYVYEMVDSEVVEPHRTDVIDDVEGEERLTLVSCYSDDGSDRIIVYGEFQKVVE
ncbi:class A sortase [Alkalibacillus almallahensis]|uniref:class A sortase n=1 Tax=Alkalibacillus almallahensis TaxID=1379154 RepID=UPI001421A9A2|nr:class A sortase [Alkalibacillus almallahensis]NIK12247.1 sortase A [Alkalibacillus almallahensis]